MKKYILLGIFISLFSFDIFASENTMESEISRLNFYLTKRAEYDGIKRNRIDSLNRILPTADKPYCIYKNLYEEYRSYNYDTALIFVNKMQAEAYRIKDTTKCHEADIARAFVYLSGGLFKESYDILYPLLKDTTSLPDDYFLTFARLLYDMADYAEGDVSYTYNKMGHALLMQLTSRLSEVDSARYWYPMATIDLREGRYMQSIYLFEKAMLDSHATSHEKAIWTSSIAFLYRQIGNQALALKYYIDAAIYDIQSSVYETVAMRMVAEILFEEGHIEQADRYIHIAMSDARHYHARYRQVSISQLLPIIEKQNTQDMHTRTVVAYILLIVALLLLIVSCVGIIMLIRRTHTLHHTRQTIDIINQNLIIANRVKEQLLSTLMVGQSQYLSAVEKYQESIKDNVVKRNINSLMSIPKNVDARIQRQLLNRRMDEMLLNIFPTFVEDFNSLLWDEYRIEVHENESLTPALRIFALIRLGISHNEVIAEILDYSINTVYTYKTRTISHSKYPIDEFYEALMRISSFNPKK